METLYIVIGAFSSIFIFLLGYAVSGVFTGKKKVTDLESETNEIHNRISVTDQQTHLRINSEVETLQRSLQEIERDIRSDLDSRLDKLQNKLTGLIPPTNEELMKRIEKIEEESYRLRMNM